MAARPAPLNFRTMPTPTSPLALLNDPTLLKTLAAAPKPAAGDQTQE